ncbi:hypothetical protein [Streptomyces sp. NPDC086835]|uniref:hypothetical protein n=1 Tax=Streptomyces sp. NPDC086835 TaxID=3365761 RepID=UPI00380A5367
MRKTLLRRAAVLAATLGLTSLGLLGAGAAPAQAARSDCIVKAMRVPELGVDGLVSASTLKPWTSRTIPSALVVRVMRLMPPLKSSVRAPRMFTFSGTLAAYMLQGMSTPTGGKGNGGTSDMPFPAREWD